MKKEKITRLITSSKIGVVAIAMLMALGIASCGKSNDPNNVELKVKQELGDLGEYMTIDSKEALLNLSEYTEGGEPYIKIMSTIQVTVKKAVASNYNFDLDIEILDKNMNKITSFGSYDIDCKTDYSTGNEYDNYLKPGNYRGVVEKSGPKSDWDGEASAIWEKIVKDGKYIALKPRWDSAKYKAYEDSSSESSSDVVADNSSEMEESVVVDTEEIAAVSGGSEDWEKIVAEYETVCTKTAALAKKAQNGDISAVTEYAELAEKASSLQSKLENAKADLTPAQAARMAKAAAKMASSMM